MTASPRIRRDGSSRSLLDIEHLPTDRITGLLKLAQRMRPAKANSTLGCVSLRDGSLCHDLSNSALSIVLLSSATNLCIENSSLIRGYSRVNRDVQLNSNNTRLSQRTLLYFVQA